MFAAFHAQSQEADADADPAHAITTITALNLDLSLEVSAAVERKSILFITSLSMLLKRNTCLERSKTNCTSTKLKTEAIQDAARMSKNATKTMTAI